jgi:uncharacterized protein YceK
MNCALNSHDASLPDVHGGQILTIKMAIAISTFSLALTGCGTAITVLQSDEDAARSLRKQKTYCQTIPRIYSGLSYDFCYLNAPPEPGGYLASFVLLDLALSGVLDTVCLPYTFYRQVTEGNLGIYWQAGHG